MWIFWKCCIFFKYQINNVHCLCDNMAKSFLGQHFCFMFKKKHGDLKGIGGVRQDKMAEWFFSPLFLICSPSFAFLSLNYFLFSSNWQHPLSKHVEYYANSFSDWVLPDPGCILAMCLFMYEVDGEREAKPKMASICLAHGKERTISFGSFFSKQKLERSSHHEAKERTWQ